MNDKNKRIYFEVTDGNGSWSYDTKEEADQQMKELKYGFPMNKHMTYENHMYWKKASKRYFIVKVIEIKEKI